MTTITLKDRHALVCGASSGIGRATALALANLGANLTLVSRNQDKLQMLANELKTKATLPKIIAVDLLDRPRLKNLISEHIKNNPVHILINNSAGPASGPLLEAKDEEFLKAFEQHVLASQLLVKALLPGMLQSGYGRIINIISTSVREPIAGLGVSNTIRGAMAGWAKTLSHELPPNVTINNVLPGYTATERLESLKKASAERQGKTPEQIETLWKSQIPEGRIADPFEIAATIAFLASPQASYIRGVSLPVDGGRMRSI